MKKLLFIFCVTFVLAGCAREPVIYYQYKAGESNFNAANSQCLARANREVVDRSVTRKTGENCTVHRSYYGGESTITCKDVYTTDYDWGYNGRLEIAYQGCMHQVGWAPCLESGQHLPECQ